MCGWAEVERDPRAFLALRVCSAAWLEQALPSLRAAARDHGEEAAVRAAEPSGTLEAVHPTTGERRVTAVVRQ